MKKRKNNGFAYDSLFANIHNSEHPLSKSALLTKAAEIMIYQSNRIHQFEELLIPIKMIVDETIELNMDNYDENQVEELNNAMNDIANILTNIQIQKCNGDCNNCDLEH